MKKFFLAFSIVCTLTVCCNSYAQNPNCTNVVGAWHNQLNSELTITKVDAATGQITGTYKSPSGGGATPFTLIGWVNQAAPAGGDNVRPIAFSVNWGSFGSITSWTGYCRDVKGVPTITAMWHLVRANSDFVWDHILTNVDTFVPGPAPK